MSAITLEQLEHICRVAAVDIDKVTAPIIRDTAKKVVETQKANVPRRSDKTYDSISASPVEAATTTVEIGPTWWVGRLIENGTSTKGPRIFVANSIDPHLAAHDKAILDAVLKQALRGLT